MKRLIGLLAFILVFVSTMGWAGVNRLDMPLMAAFDSNGDPGTGMQLFVYEAGTSTKVDLYKDSTYSSAHTNPVILNSSGRPAGDYPIYTHNAGDVKLVLAPSDDTDPPVNPIWTVDNYKGTSVTNATVYRVSEYADLAAAATAVNALSDCLLVFDDDQTMDESVTFDAEVSCVPMPGNVIITTGYTLTFNGPFIGGEHYEEVFSGTGNIVFAAGSCDFIRPEWYGIDGTTDETQINYALADATSVHNVKLMPGKTYTLTTAGLSILGDNIKLYAEGGMATITTAVDIVGITIGGTASDLNGLENLNIVSTNVASTKAGILLSSGASQGLHRNVKVDNFKYGVELYDASNVGIYYNNFSGLNTDNIITYDIYILTSATGYVNENRFENSKLSFDNTAIYVEDGGNDPTNNTFIDIACESTASTTWAIVDQGLSSIRNCQLKSTLGRGILVTNAATAFDSTTRIFNNSYSITGGIDLVVKGSGGAGTCLSDKFAYSGTFSGNIEGGTMGDTTIDAESASGQKDVNLTATTKFHPGWYFVIDEGESDEEWGIIDTVTAADKITAIADLSDTHDIASTVSTYGRPNGTLAYYTSDATVSAAAETAEIWANQQLIKRFDDGTSANDGLMQCKAWVAFAGSDGTIASSYNVTSVTDNGAGDYTVNFTTAMADANYAVFITKESDDALGYVAQVTSGGTKSTAAVQVETITAAGAHHDMTEVYVAIFGN